MRAAEWVLGQLVTYYHITKDTNCVMDDIAKWALEAKATITLWEGQVPKDVPGNQLQDVF